MPARLGYSQHMDNLVKFKQLAVIHTDLCKIFSMQPSVTEYHSLAKSFLYNLWNQ